MTRVSRGKTAAKRHKRYLKKSIGYRGLNSSSSTLASEQIIQSANYQYIGRKIKKRNFRKIWINNVNCTLKLNNKHYYNFSNILKKKLVYINYKLLSYSKNNLFNYIS